MKYTITFDPTEEAKFRRIRDRLAEDEFTVVEDITPYTEEKTEEKRFSTVMEMDPEAALTFRLGMKHVIIRRERTQEELDEEAALEAANTVKITVIVPPGSMPGPTP